MSNLGCFRTTAAVLAGNTWWQRALKKIQGHLAFTPVAEPGTCLGSPPIGGKAPGDTRPNQRARKWAGVSYTPMQSLQCNCWRTNKLETTKPAGGNFLQQQACFDDVIDSYNTERPHQALAMRCPAQLYRPSRRPYQGLPELDYPFHDKAVIVNTCGRIGFNTGKINLSQVFAG